MRIAYRDRSLALVLSLSVSLAACGVAGHENNEPRERVGEALQAYSVPTISLSLWLSADSLPPSTSQVGTWRQHLPRGHLRALR
jgi:hypothetical protein